MKVSKLSFSLIAILFFTACSDDNDFPAIPQLSVRSFTQISPDEVIWVIGFTDGDGDFGVRNDNDADNFILTIYSIEDGQAIEQPATPYRIPQIKDVPTDKGVEGEFRLRIDNLDLVRLSGIDSLYYRGYAIDRSGKQSNTVESPRFGI
ncbi:MAG: hypothetical protein CMP59_05930 [Flavobacteriales bacterium]|nr:hypothetical protein [Flavobacteriales bacterium]